MLTVAGAWSLFDTCSGGDNWNGRPSGYRSVLAAMKPLLNNETERNVNETVEWNGKIDEEREREKQNIFYQKNFLGNSIRYLENVHNQGVSALFDQTNIINK